MFEKSVRKYVAGLAGVFLVAFSGLVVAEAADGDESAIREAAAAYLDAANRGDLKAMRSHWTDDGNLIDASGQTLSIREMERAAGEVGNGKTRTGGAAAGNGEQPELAARPESIRFVTPDVAIEDGASEFGAGSSRGRYSVVWVRRDGKWLIDAVRESAEAGSPKAKENPIGELQWLVGDWVEEGDAAALQASYRWSPKKNYLIGEMKITPRGQESHVVTQRVAYDASEGRVRSWNFDSDGGFSEGDWTRGENGWVVVSTGVLPDGKRTLGRRIIRKIDDDTVVLESLDVQVDGAAMPDLRVKLVRQ